MSIKFDLTDDFFSLNPAFKTEFKPYSSEEMWAVSILEHKDSPYSNFSRREKLDVISQTFKNVEVSEELIDKFNSITLSKAQKFLKSWERKLEEREDFIASLEYNEDTFEMLDKMMSSTEKLWKQYLSILKQVEQEADSETLGGQEESLSEKGII